MADRFDLDSLAEELTPVRTLRPGIAIAVLVGMTLAGGAFVVSTLGFRHGLLGSTATDPMFLLRTGLLIVMAAATLTTAVGMARPAVGKSRNGWRWAAGAALTVPIAATIAAAVSQTPLSDRLYPENGIECLTYSVGFGLIMSTVLTAWLRHGAPTSPERAGTIVGLASGSLGSLAYSMHCPHNDIVYIGLWYTMAIGVTTLIGRLVLPRFIRW